MDEAKKRKRKDTEAGTAAGGAFSSGDERGRKRARRAEVLDEVAPAANFPYVRGREGKRGDIQHEIDRTAEFARLAAEMKGLAQAISSSGAVCLRKAGSGRETVSSSAFANRKTLDKFGAEGELEAGKKEARGARREEETAGKAVAGAEVGAHVAGDARFRIARFERKLWRATARGNAARVAEVTAKLQRQGAAAFGSTRAVTAAVTLWVKQAGDPAYAELRIDGTVLPATFATETGRQSRIWWLEK